MRFNGNIHVYHYNTHIADKIRITPHLTTHLQCRWELRLLLNILIFMLNCSNSISRYNLFGCVMDDVCFFGKRLYLS